MQGQICIHIAILPTCVQEERELCGKVELDAVGYTIPAGHAILLVLSPGCLVFYTKLMPLLENTHPDPYLTIINKGIF
jgi:hypothetical protein